MPGFKRLPAQMRQKSVHSPGVGVWSAPKIAHNILGQILPSSVCKLGISHMWRLYSIFMPALSVSKYWPVLTRLAWSRRTLLGMRHGSFTPRIVGIVKTNLTGLLEDFVSQSQRLKKKTCA
jgi:hypothetical protein